MSNIYCSSCGAKNTYELKRPNFCNNCGASFTDSSSRKDDSIKVKEKKIESSLNEEESDSTFVPNISKLEYEVDYTEANNFFEFSPPKKGSKNIKPLKKSRGRKKKI